MSEAQEQAGIQVESLTIAGAGRILVQERERAGLSQEEVAATLRLTPRQVIALETGDLEALPGLAFVRGFIRNYAKLLKIDPEPLVEIFRQNALDPAKAHISLQTENIVIGGRRTPRPWRSYLIVIVLLVLILGGWMWYRDYQDKQPAMPSQEMTPIEQPLSELAPFAPPAEVAPIQQPEPAATGEIPLELPISPEPAPASQPGTPVESGVALPAAPAATAVAPEKPAESASAAGTATIRLTFTEPSWVSVSDKDGKVILDKTVAAGISESVEGKPPFRLIVGNARGAQVMYKDQPVDLTLHTKGNVARFTLE